MKSILSIAILGSIILLFSFAKKPTKTQEELSEEYIQNKLIEFRIGEWEKCNQNTINDAIAYVDSIIYKSVDFSIGDSIKTPGKPVRPERPFKKLDLDSTPIVPIVIDSANRN